MICTRQLGARLHRICSSYSSSAALVNNVLSEQSGGWKGSIRLPLIVTRQISEQKWKNGGCSDMNYESRRSYSKAKDKGNKKKSVVKINEDEMDEVINTSSFKSQLDSTLNQMKDEYASQLSIRGAAGALELLEVEFEGEKYPLQELAQIGRKNPQLAVLNLASLPEACQPVMKAIQECGMQLNPQQEGTTIYIPLPKVTREHRENLAKNAKVIFTKYKTSFQNVQNKYIKQCKNHKEVSEDVVFSVSQQITKMTEGYIADAEKVMHDKQAELLDTIS